LKHTNSLDYLLVWTRLINGWHHKNSASKLVWSRLITVLGVMNTLSPRTIADISYHFQHFMHLADDFPKVHMLFVVLASIRLRQFYNESMVIIFVLCTVQAFTEILQVCT